MLDSFTKEIALKYHLYNSLFLRLPFDQITRTGQYLPLLSKQAQELLNKDAAPEEIITGFFREHQIENSDKAQLDLLFKFIQYIERQVVLFDAIEDAGFDTLNNLEGPGTLSYFFTKKLSSKQEKTLNRILSKGEVRLVLTAHPTQFYPDSVLQIIQRLSEEIQNNNLEEINLLLLQLGKTPFLKDDKPTPLDEAEKQIWYLEHIFYAAIKSLLKALNRYCKKHQLKANLSKLFVLGFWPGGDRDGNPYVNHQTTVAVVNKLQHALLRCYLRDLEQLSQKLTFKEVDILIKECLVSTEQALYQQQKFSADHLTKKLHKIKDIVSRKHQGIFSEDLELMINLMATFQEHFAELDIRQDSSVIRNVLQKLIYLEKNISAAAYNKLTEPEKISILRELKLPPDLHSFKDPVEQDLINVIKIIPDIQKQYSKQAIHRFIISNCQSACDLLSLHKLHQLIHPGQDLNVDFIPLFETIQDLQSADKIMQQLFEEQDYADHLQSRSAQQTVMLGFSDGTKDGGYISANWNIYQAKEKISKTAEQYNYSLKFFDGRGGPPARGGGNTHKFYASLDPSINTNSIQLTIQGQTISSNFGTIQSARYNIEQLLTAELNRQVSPEQIKFTGEDKKCISTLASIGNQKYSELKNDPNFLKYLQRFGTLPYYAETNIASRPTSRSKQKELTLKSLRAIPFVGSWSQLKQNVPGYYGLGTALSEFGDLKSLRKLYKNCLFFKTLIDNSMQSLLKANFQITTAHQKDTEFSEFWKLLKNEYDLTIQMILEITKSKELMHDNAEIKASIMLREEIVLPLVIIQHYAISRIHDQNTDREEQDTYKKMVIRSMFGIINAGRNSA